MISFSVLWQRGRQWRPEIRVEMRALFAFCSSSLFWISILAGRSFVPPASRDHLLHSLLGLLDVRTTGDEKGMDLSATCRSQ